MPKEIQEILTTLLPFLEDMTSEHKLILWIGILLFFSRWIFLKYKKERDQKKLESENYLKLEQQKSHQDFELQKNNQKLLNQSIKEIRKTSQTFISFLEKYHDLKKL